MTTRALDRSVGAAQTITLATRDGLVMTLRPVTEADAGLLRTFFDRLSPEDLRFRFLSASHHLPANQIAALVNVDHRHSEHLLAFDAASRQLVATVLIAADPGMETAEVAISVSPTHKGRGIGWTLLKHSAEMARERGVRRLLSIESRANRQAIEVERALGFSTTPYDGDASLVLVQAHLR